MKKLEYSEIEKKLKDHEGWKYEDNKIRKSYELKDFSSVMSFVNKVADEAEAMDHHPDILIHSWNKVDFTLSTHSEGGVTLKDFDLAEKIDSLLRKLFN
jgi:4a-hydroxytetrahydrobiopterin dehydratase